MMSSIFQMINKHPKIKEYKGGRRKVLLTGGAGFVGSHICEGILKDTDWDVIIMDRLDISGNLHRLLDMDIWETEKDRVEFIWWDLKSPFPFKINVDYVLHLAASSHVDRSIEDPQLFVMDNVLGTTNLLWAMKDMGIRKGIVFGTDEVFGPAPEGIFYKEWDRYNSTNPYSASKAGADEMAKAFANTYKMPLTITHGMNIFGERQHPEKFIPLVIRKVLNDEEVTIHANKDKTKAGKRHYIHARNVWRALKTILEKGDTLNGKEGFGKYNIVGEKEMDNLELAKTIAKIIGKPLKYKMVDFHSTRPGHDLRYALDGSRLKELGHKHPKSFEKSLGKTVNWYLNNKNWL
jgi:dTDP-glucose 4,6-dehydratase